MQAVGLGCIICRALRKDSACLSRLGTPMFASTGSTGHLLRSSPPIPGEMNGHMALGLLITGMGSGPNYTAHTRGALSREHTHSPRGFP